MSNDLLRARLDTLQTEHTTWVEHNFGAQNEQHPFFGVVEEVGELFHALLKLAQGIRVTEAHHENVEDSIGDVLIYTMNLCEIQNIQMSSVWPGLHEESIFVGRRPLIRIVYYLGEIAGYFASGGKDTAQMHDRVMLYHALRAFLASLDAFCNENQFDMHDILNETWAEVRKRDWTKNKTDGRVLA